MCGLRSEDMPTGLRAVIPGLTRDAVPTPSALVPRFCHPFIGRYRGLAHKAFGRMYLGHGSTAVQHASARFVLLLWTMTLLFPLTELLYELYPDAKGKPDALVAAMKAFYTVDGIAPNVQMKEGVIEVEVDTERIASRRKEFQQAVASCEAGKFETAREQLQALVAVEPNNSEYHRLLGQVCTELGEPEAAIDHLIDALRWDPKNVHALLMMGNLQAKHRKEIDTAMRYYEAALEAEPEDHLAANNIAAQFLNLGKWTEAKTWFEKTLAIAPDYPNARHGLSIVLEKSGDVATAFYEATEALRHNGKRDELYHQSLGLAQRLATELVAEGLGKATVQQMCAHLQKQGGTPVRSIADPSIGTAAKLELAENYERDEHVVRYKPEQPGVEHLELHELYHLRYIIEARAAGLNELFTAGASHRDAFMTARAKDQRRLTKQASPRRTRTVSCAASSMA